MSLNTSKAEDPQCQYFKPVFVSNIPVNLKDFINLFFCIK